MSAPANPCNDDPPPLEPDEDEQKVWQERVQQCSDPKQTPLISEEDLKSSVPDILGKLGIKKCETMTGVKANCNWFRCEGTAGVETAGCEQIQVLASKLIMQTRIQMCTLNKIAQEQRQGQYTVQQIEFNNFGDSLTECGNGFRVSNSIKLKKIDRNALSATMSNVMSAEILQTIVESFQQQQSQSTGFMGTSSGQRLISDVLTAISTDLMLQSINCSIQKIIDRVQTNQTIIINNGPRSIIRAAQCDISNEMELEKTSESIVLSAMQSVMDVKAVTDYFKAMSTFQDNKVEGFSLGLGGIIAIIAALLIAGLVTIGLFFKYGSSVMEKKGTQTLIICITVGVILTAIVGLIVAAMNAKAKKDEFDRKYPPCPAEGPCVPCEEGKACNDGPADDEDTSKPPGPCQTITLDKPARGWTSFMTLKSTTTENQVTSNITFPQWDQTKETLTMCIGDFIREWNAGNWQHFGQLYLEPNGTLTLSQIQIPGVQPNAQFRILGDINWWRRMGFSTDKPFTVNVPIKATSKPFNPK